MTCRSDEITMGNPNIVHGFSYHDDSDAQKIDKRILYNIPSGAKYFYSEMIMHT